MLDHTRHLGHSCFTGATRRQNRKGSKMFDTLLHTALSFLSLASPNLNVEQVHTTDGSVVLVVETDRTVECPLVIPDGTDDDGADNDPDWLELIVGWEARQDGCKIPVVDVHGPREDYGEGCWEHMSDLEQFGPTLQGALHPYGCPDHYGMEVERMEEVQPKLVRL